jgi:hypothetical protein
MDARLATQRWAETWSEAWPAKDADAVADLYAKGAVFRSQPFRSVHRGPAGARDYAEWAFSEQDDAECWFGTPVVDGRRATVEYWAVVSFEGRDETIAGIAVIRFDDDGLVAEQRDYWNAQDGRHEPPGGWASS